MDASASRVDNISKNREKIPPVEMPVLANEAILNAHLGAYQAGFEEGSNWGVNQFIGGVLLGIIILITIRVIGNLTRE